MEYTTPVSTWVILLVLKNLKNIAELDHKPTNALKAKGAKGKFKMEPIDSRIPKKAQMRKHCMLDLSN